MRGLKRVEAAQCSKAVWCLGLFCGVFIDHDGSSHGCRFGFENFGGGDGCLGLGSVDSSGLSSMGHTEEPSGYSWPQYGHFVKKEQCLLQCSN